MPDPETVPGLGLDELVLAVRRELANLERKEIESGIAPLFQLDELELEINFSVVHSKDGHGGFDLKVVSLGGSMGLQSSETQRVTLRYQVDKGAIGAKEPGSRAEKSNPRRTKGGTKRL